jgi:hypothetical protein
MTTTMTDRTSELLADANNRSSNYARALGRMQGTAQGVIFHLQMALSHGDMSDLDKNFLQQSISQLQAALDETSNPQEMKNNK